MREAYLVNREALFVNREAVLASRFPLQAFLWPAKISDGSPLKTCRDDGLGVLSEYFFSLRTLHTLRDTLHIFVSPAMNN
ncbi:MAG: hypothetical protein ACE1ZO_01290 [Nitrospirales bacterium]